MQSDKDRAIVTVLTLMSLLAEHPEFDSFLKAELKHLFNHIQGEKKND